MGEGGLDPRQELPTNGGVRAISGDQQVGRFANATGEDRANAPAVLLDALEDAGPAVDLGR